MLGGGRDTSRIFLNLRNTSSKEEAECLGSTITGTEVAEVVKSSMVDEICSEFIKALDVVGLSWLTCLCNIAWTWGVITQDWQTGMVISLFKRIGGSIPIAREIGMVYAGVLEKRVQLTVKPQI